jgi:hypothetical protein
MRCPALGVRRLHRNGPGLAIRPEAHRTHLAIDPDKRVGNPMLAQGFGQPVDAITLRDAVEIKRDGHGLAHMDAVELKDVMRRAARGRHRRADAIRRGVPGPEAPGRHSVAHADVERSA